MQQISNRFAEYMEDFRSQDQKMRTQAAKKFNAQFEKEIREILAEPRQQLTSDIQNFLKLLVQQKDEPQQMSCALIIEQIINSRTPVIQLNLLEDHLYQLSTSHQQNVLRQGAQLIGKLIQSQSQYRPVSLVSRIYQQIPSLIRVNISKANGVALLNMMLQCDQQVVKYLQHQPIIVQDAFQFVIDTKGEVDLGPECYVNILYFKGLAEAFSLVMNSLKSTNSLSACFVIIQLMLDKIFNEQSTASNTNKTNELRNLLLTNYEKIFSILFEKSSSKDLNLFKKIQLLIPSFARFDVNLFKEKFLGQSIKFLLEKTGKFASLFVVGRVAEIVGADAIEIYFAQIIKVLLESIQNNQKSKDFSPDVLNCIKCLSKACPNQLKIQIEDLLDVMFSYGLCQELVNALSSLIQNVDNWTDMIEERLLQLIGMEVAGVDLKVISGLLVCGLTTSMKTPLRQTGQILLALQTLNQDDFKFSKFDLTYFIQDYVVKFLGDDNYKIRSQAGQAILKHLYKKKIGANQVAINLMISQLLIVMCTDFETQVRINISLNLVKTNSFDEFIAQKENLDVIFVGVNDCNYQVRSNIVNIIGRLSNIHPVIVLPQIREILQDLIFEIDNSNDKDGRMENLHLLLTIVRFCSNLIEPYLTPIIDSIQKIMKTDERMINISLQVISELFKQKGKFLVEYITILIQQLVVFLQEQRSDTKLETLRSLQDITIGTGLSVIPYFVEVDLLNILIKLITNEKDNEVIKEASKTIAILGTLDYNVINSMVKVDDISKVMKYYKENDFDNLTLCVDNTKTNRIEIVSHGTAAYDPVTDQITDNNQIIKIDLKSDVQRKQQQQDIDYFSVVLNILKSLFSDSSKEQYYNDAVLVFRRIIEQINAQSDSTSVWLQQRQIIEFILKKIFDILLSTQQLAQKESILTHIIIIISYLQRSVKYFIKELFEIAYKLWDEEKLTPLVFALVEEVCVKYPDIDFTQQNQKIVQKLLEFYSNVGDKGNEITVIRSLSTLTVLIPCMKSQIKVLLPSLLRIAKNHEKKQLCIAVLDCIGRICCCINIGQIQMSSSIIQTLLQIMAETYNKYRNYLMQYYTQNPNLGVIEHYKKNPVGYKAFETLHYVASQLGRSFNIFVPVVNSIIVDYNYQSVVFNVIITAIMRNLSIHPSVFISATFHFSKLILQKVKTSDLEPYNYQPIKEMTECQQFSYDVAIEHLLDNLVLLQKEKALSFKQFVFYPQPPSNIGADKLIRSDSLIVAVEQMPKKDWLCDDIDDQWRGWLAKLSDSIIRYSPTDCIRSCYQLSQKCSFVQRELFNYAFISFLLDQNIGQDVKVAANQALKKALSNDKIPQDILQQLLDLVEFLEHNNSQPSQLNDISLGTIAEKCLAFARCLRYREIEFTSAPQTTLDILVKINKKLSLHESAKGLIIQEMQRLNMISIQLFNDILTKRSTQCLTELSSKQLSFDEVAKSTQVMMCKLFTEDASSFRSPSGSFKSLVGGCLGGIFIETRPVNSGIMSQISKTDFDLISQFLINQVKRIIASKFSYSPDLVEQLSIVILQEVKILSQVLLQQFGPRPQWFESLNWYDKAYYGYNEQIIMIEQSARSTNDLSKIRESLKSHQTNYLMKIGCLFHLGNYQELLDQCNYYIRYIGSIQGYDASKLSTIISKFQQSVAKFCIQSALEVDQKNVNTWINCLGNAKSPLKLLFLSIYNIQNNKIDAAEQLANELIDLLMIPIVAGCLESYERAYDSFIILQNAVEIKEIIQYKKKELSFASSSLNLTNYTTAISGNTEEQQLLKHEKEQLKNIWSRRLANTRRDIDVWLSMLRVRQLLIPKSEDMPIYINFALTCMQAGRMNLAKSILEQLLNFQPKKDPFKITKEKQSGFYVINTQFTEKIQPIVSQNFSVTYAYCKYLYSNDTPDQKIQSFIHLNNLKSDVIQSLQACQSIESGQIDLLQRIFVRLADWYSELIQPIHKNSTQLIAGSYGRDQDMEYREVEDSAISNVLTNLQKFLQQESNVNQTPSMETSISEFEKSNQVIMGDTKPQLVAKAIQYYLKDELKELNINSQFDNYISGYSVSQIALNWFSNAASKNQSNIKVQRCISHTTSVLVELIDDFQKRYNQQQLTPLPNQISQQDIVVLSNNDQELLEKQKISFQIQSIQSHFKCIQTPEFQLPSALRLLTLWFLYGKNVKVEDEFIKGLASVNIDVWLEVVPQLIARSTCDDSEFKRIKYLIQQLLISIGLKYPQLLVFPLLVASRRENVDQQAEALSILDQIRRQHFDEVDETIKVGHELVRVSILWAEMVQESIQAAILTYNTTKDKMDFLIAISIMMQQLDRNDETESERVFKASFQDSINAAWDNLKAGVVNNDLSSIETAKAKFTDIHERLQESQNNNQNLEVAQCSKILSSLRGSKVALPGSVTAQSCKTKNYGTIYRFFPQMNIIASKQRPRKIAVVASDGEIYAYLLKGKEDLRQDERVMQLLGLVNQLLQSDQLAARRQMYATRYPCVPIDKNSGLLFWVPRSDTIHDLIKNNRTSKGFQTSLEELQMTQRASKYTALSLTQKLDTFKNIIQYCPATDLKQVFWDSSQTSEQWLARRSTYTVSLAVMSIVGYILGLGDRHPANIMINRSSGQILHIDYGDCFEAAQRRAKLPEQIPFRLTRILVNAMEVCGYNGLFVRSAQLTMKIIRKNKDSILAILETFVHDPLLGWKAMNGSDLVGEPMVAIREDDGASGTDPIQVVRRIENKLCGRDVDDYDPLNPEQQVELLVNQATSLENLCQSYFGWCPHW